VSIIKNKIPILEYDDTPMSVIMPTHEHLDIQLPDRVVFAFLGRVIDRYAEDRGAKIAGTFLSITKKFPIYVLNYKGQEIALCQAPVGAAASTQILDWLIGYGAKKIIATGSCGVLTDVAENSFLIPVRALRDEGTSYHYLPPSRYIDLNQYVLHNIQRGLKERGIPYSECVTWTTDGFYRETKDMVTYRKQEGCTVVDMECAALAACAQFRGVEFGQLLFTADSLANLDAHDKREWGRGSMEKALKLSMDLVLEL